MATQQNSASDIRSVIKNATQGGLINPLAGGTVGKGNTIATKQEITQANNKPMSVNPKYANKTTKKTEAPKTNVATTTPPRTENPNIKSNVNTQPIQNSNIVGPNIGFSVPVTVGQQNNKSVITSPQATSNARIKKAAQPPINTTKAVEDLFLDIDLGRKEGRLGELTLEGIKENYPEFQNMDDNALLGLCNDLLSFQEEGSRLTDDNLDKIRKAYPELTTAAWGFDTKSNPNMYQAGGMREAMAAGSKTDLNKYGAVGAVAEGVMNPIGEATSLLDMGAQQIGQVDNNTDKILGFWDIKSTPELKQALSKLTDEDIANYKKQYDRYVKNNPTLSKLYTTTIEGDTVVEQLWNIVKGNTKSDVEGGFRDWLIDRVNNDVNGWQGEFWGAADELKGVSGPNVAKMYANMPASLAKTSTAIARAVTNPLDTVSGLYELGKDAYKHLQDGTFNQSILGQRYGSWEAFAKAMEQDPVGVSSDALAIVEGGAGAAKTVAGKTSTAMKAFSNAANTVGAQKAGANLIRIADRLDTAASKFANASDIAGRASNLGTDILFHGYKTPGGQVIFKGLVEGLRELGNNTPGMIGRLERYAAKTQTPLKTADGIAKDIKNSGVKGYIGDKLTGAGSAEQKLVSATKPTINTLRGDKNYKGVVDRAKLADEAIADYVIENNLEAPKNTEERVKTANDTLNDLWEQYNDIVDKDGKNSVEAQKIIKDAEDYINSLDGDILVKDKEQVAKLRREIDALKQRGTISIGSLEKIKRRLNADYKAVLDIGDIYNKGLKKIADSIRNVENDVLSTSPNEVKELSKRIGALLDIIPDLEKADIVQQRKNKGGLIESAGYMTKAGAIGGAVVSGNFGLVAAGLASDYVGKAISKSKDVNYKIESGYKGLIDKRKQFKTLGVEEANRLARRSDLDRKDLVRLAKTSAKNMRKQNDNGLSTKLADIIKANASGMKNLKTIAEYKKFIDTDLKKGLSKKDYDSVIKYIEENPEYAVAQGKSRVALGDKEANLSTMDKKTLLDWVNKHANNPGYVARLLDESGMMKALKEAGEKQEKGVQGFTDPVNKYLNLIDKPTDTTLQHEFFHSVFTAVDNKTKNFLLQEAKKILKEEGISNVNAEEWLAESFGIYAKRKMIDTGVIKAPRSLKDKMRNFFQKVYEWIQNFNGDRETINRIFDEIYGGSKKLTKKGLLDLSYLLEGKEVKNQLGVSNGLRKKSVYHGSPADFDKFDSSHMGEGEGAQAHGWGHYVAVNEGTARHYAGMRYQNEKTYKGKKSNEIPFDTYNVKDMAVKFILNRLRILKDEKFADAVKGERESILRDIKANKESINSDLWKEDGYSSLKQAKEMLKWREGIYEELGKLKEEDFGDYKGRNLYNLDIPDPVKADTPTGSNYFEEGDTISPKAGKKIADKLREKGHAPQDDIFGHSEEYLNRLLGSIEKGEDGRAVYEDIAVYLGGQKEASKFLESLGYDGIHYFGRGDGEAYVIFNDDALKIKEHIRYKKKIDGKDVEITPKVTSPDDLIEKNADGLSVMKSFISEKQAEKALNVNKALLDENGNAYLWTHTNKYKDSMFSQFENTKDNRYKDFADTEVAFFSNSEDMSKSYADQKSKLAPTKKFNSVEEVNDYFKKNPVVEKWEGWHETENERIKNYRMVKAKNLKGEDYWKLESQNVEKTTYDSLASLWDAYRDDWMQGNLGEMPKNPEEAIKILKEKRFGDATEIKQLKNGKVEKKDTYDWKYVWGYDTDKEAIAKGYAEGTNPSAYHYQGIIQDVKNPLVVDVRNPDGTQTFWNKLGNAKAFIEKEYPKFNKHMDKVADKFNEANAAKKSFDVWMDDINDKKWELLGEAEKLERGTPERDRISDKVSELRVARDKIEKIFRGKIEPLTPEERAIPIKNRDLGYYYDKAKSIYDNHKDVYDIWKGYGEILDGNKQVNVSDAYREAQAALHKGFFKFLEGQEGFDKGLVSLIHRGMPEEIYLYMFNGGDPIRINLEQTKLQTNDYVFYALEKGGYDGVIFKGISDYGGDAKGDKGGDVLTTFKSKNFKSWDNSNPTDSKYISYKKKVSLDKKSEGLSKKNSSGLLAKGRDRMGDNGMRYKKEVPEDKKLVGLHNLGIDKLRGVIELGGMPMPSIAVTKKGVPHESYGDITFIMKESAINPALSRKNKLYTVDGYTPTVPQPTIKVKDTKEANLLMDKIQKETGIGYGELMQWLEYHDDRYFKDYPKLKEFDKYYDQLTEKKLFDGFTYTGKRRYKDYNLDNIVKSMVGNKRDAFNGAFWKMVAQSQGNTTVEKLRDRTYGLKDKDLAEKIGEKYYDALRELASKKGIEQKIESLSDYGRFAENVSDAYRANTDAWWRELTQWDGAEGTIYSKITKEDLEPLQKIIKEAAELPRPYSEAKPERAIRFNEVGAVVAPEGKLKEVKDMLKDTGLKVYGYKEGERMSTIDKVADDNGLRFKKKVDQTQTPEFKKWFEGSKVVDKSGKPMVVYHGTHNDFNTFDRSKVGLKTKNKGFFGEGFYFTTSEKLADSYADSWWDTKEGKKGKVMAVYLDVKKPFMWNDYKGPEAIEKLRKELGLSEDVLKWNNYGDNGIKEFGFMDEDNAVKFREALQKKGYDGVWLKRENGNNEIVAFEPNQIKSATDNIGTFDKNNPDIRYKKGLQKKESGLERKDIRYKLAKGAKENGLAKNSERDILWSKRLLEQAAKNGGIKFTSRNGGYTIDDALETLKEINPYKDKVSTSQAIKNAKNGMIEQINKAIDDGNGGDWHYQWFFDPLESRTPTVVYWKGNDMKKEVLAGREISFHQPKGRKYKYVPKGKLTISPVRLRDWGRLK